MIVMTRRVTFSAAHADWLPQLTDEENVAIFGARASPAPYGHNYVLDISVQGSVDPRTGILVNIKEIDRIVKESVVQLLDRKFINQQAPAFESRPVTPENLARFIERVVSEHLPPQVNLVRVGLESTPTERVEWDKQNMRIGKDAGAMLMTRAYEFSASHRLHSDQLTAEENRELFGKCNYESGHGHNYELEVTVAGPVDERTGRVMDPHLLDAVVDREVIERYDHRHLNLDVPEFRVTVPSAEEITRAIWKRLHHHIPLPARLYRVLLRETPRNIFETYGEDEDA